MAANSGTLDLLEGMATARSIRRYRFEPIPDEDLAKILYAATRAPSGTNRQPFRFLVLRDGSKARQAKAVLGESFRRGWAEKCESEGWLQGSALQASSPKARSVRAMQYFVENFEKIPVVVLACLWRQRPPNPYEGSSVYPACQNLLLAARALGYGACFSGWHHRVEDELRSLLGIPRKVALSMCITLGKPLGRHGPLRRLPVRQLVYEDEWEGHAQWIDDPPGSRLAKSRPVVVYE